MSLDAAFAFACRLRGDPTRINDASWRDDRSDASWAYKVYDGGRRVALGGALPWWIPMPTGEADDPKLRLGRLLFHAMGVSRVRWQAGGTILSNPEHPEWVWPTAQLVVRRPVPSGGALYPAEVYVAALDGLGVAGVFHYDPARHELIDLAQPRLGPMLRAGLGVPEEAPIAAMALILTHRFCKNLHKYGNFAYRLGAVDVGVVLGRLMACGVVAFGQVELRLDFHDATLNAMCGLDGREEGAYAVVALGTPRSLPPDRSPLVTAAPGSSPAVLERGRPARPSALFAAMHAAACHLETGRRDLIPATCHDAESSWHDASQPAPGILLPAPLPPPTEQRRALLERTSNGGCFTGAALGANVLATVLHRTHEAIEMLRSRCGDVDPPVVRLYCAVEQVEGVQPGWYRYEPVTHRLVRTTVDHATSPGLELQKALYAATVDLERSAFSLHIATVIDFRRDRRGVRAYRVQQLFVGAAVEAATRWSAVTGAGSHPLHGFDAQRVDRWYGLADGPFGVQAQVSIGATRPAGSLEGSVTT